MQQWDVDENEKAIGPDTVTAGSDFVAAWQCGNCCEHCGAPHAWRARVADRVANGSNCPCCSGRKICPCQSLAAQCPDLMEQWNSEANADVDPRQLGLASHAKVSWQCSLHGPWLAKVYHRAGGTGYPGEKLAPFFICCKVVACLVVRREGACMHCCQDAKSDPCCAECRRVAQLGSSLPARGLLRDEFPEIFAQLHPTLNEDLESPEMLTCGSNKKLYWQCKEDSNRPPGCEQEHTWQARIGARCRKKSSGCPFCAGKRVCPCNSMAQLEPGVLRFWHCNKNKGLSPNYIGAQSHLKAWWQHVYPITGDSHSWEARMCNVVKAYRRAPRAPCPICKLQKREAGMY